MKNVLYIVGTFLIFLGGCINNKIEPAIIKKGFTIDSFNKKISIAYNSEHYITYKIFEESPCFPKILYHSKYFDKKPFFAYRSLPVNIDNSVVFIDHYGIGIDSLNYKELEIKYLLNGEQIIQLHNVFVVNECYAIGNDVTTRLIKRKEIPEIAKKWKLRLTK